MEYIRNSENGQLIFTQSDEFLKVPSTLYGFTNTDTEIKTSRSGKSIYIFKGEVAVTEEDLVCPECGARMHVHAHNENRLSHLPMGGKYSQLVFPHDRLFCPKCRATKSQFISFKATNFRMTEELHSYVRDLLATGMFTLKEVSELTGVGKNAVKAIDKKRLEEKYTLNGKKLVQPEHKARFLGIDEFKLHNGHRYATIIVDLTTGHVLWIAFGKKKQVVYDFIDHVGMDWMEHVEAVACDMNSDFQEAFEERCEWIQPVFDHFHIIKNFNDKVVSEVRKDEQRRLREEGDFKAAESLKKTKYILTASRSTLQKKDLEAQEGRVISKGSELFKKEEVTRKGGQEAKCDALLKQNILRCGQGNA